MAKRTGNDRNNYLNGTAGDDVIKGLGGDDVLIGNAGNDRIYGGDGVDELDGGAGNDKLFGDAGTDIMLVSSGNDMIDGGSGVNMLNLRNANQGISMSLADHFVAFSGSTGTGTTEFKNVAVVQGSSFDDELTGDAFRNMLRGGYGDDTLWGGDGNDYIFGADGQEVLTGGNGRDGFLFGAVANANNFDQVVDFSDDDWLAFDNLFFEDLKAAAGSTKRYYAEITTRNLDVDQFQAGEGHAALTADVRIIYDSADGILYYDADGSGAGEAQAIADIGVNHDLSAADIFVF
jgi:Ca2+-binding RTX toxin-like protein